MAEGLKNGHLSFGLKGHKLTGGYSLRRTRGGEKPQWLLVKRRDDDADARRNPVSTQPESVLSGRTIEDLRSEAAHGQRRHEGRPHRRALLRPRLDLRAKARRHPLHRGARRRRGEAALAQRPVAQRPLAAAGHRARAAEGQAVRHRRRGGGLRPRADQLPGAGRRAEGVLLRLRHPLAGRRGRAAEAAARAQAAPERGDRVRRRRPLHPAPQRRRARRCTRRPAARAGRA